MTRTLLRRLLPALACLCAAPAAAQPYPSQPIKLIVPYPPGGNTDIVARIYAQKLSERLGQPVVIDNRGGAAGALGMGVAAKSPNDGYTLVIGDLGSLVIGPISKPGIGYDPQKDLAPISVVSAVSIVVTANPKSPDQLDAGLACAREGATRQAQPGHRRQGGPGHLALELLRSMTGRRHRARAVQGRRRGRDRAPGRAGRRRHRRHRDRASQGGEAEGDRRHRPAVAGAARRAQHRRDGQGLRVHQLVGHSRPRRHAARGRQPHQPGVDGDRRDARRARAPERPRARRAEQHAAAVRRPHPHRDRQGREDRQGRRASSSSRRRRRVARPAMA